MLLHFQVLGSLALSLSCLVDCGTLQGSNPNIGVVEQSLVVNWTYKSNKDPTEVTILVGHLNKTYMLKIWAISFSDINPIWTETDIDSSNPEAVFAKNTVIRNEGTKVFHLTLKSVPANVQEFRFACRVLEGAWSTPVLEDITIKLASEFIVAHFFYCIHVPCNMVSGIIRCYSCLRISLFVINIHHSSFIIIIHFFYM